MAEVLIHKIEFIENNLFGTYVAGDVIEVYLEETSIISAPSVNSPSITGVVTYLNDVLITSGVMIDVSPEKTAIQNFNTQICFGTELVVPSLYVLFPFATYYTLPNHWSCAVSPAACDLILVGPPTVVPATGDDQADGQITITATSSYTIQYNLGSDFVYGSGQSSGVFTALLPGSYRIFLRDAKNCAVNVLVEVSVNNTYGAIYRLEYDDIYNFSTTKIDITQRGYSGAVTEITGGSSPFDLMLRGEGITDKFVSVLSTQGNINLTSETEQFFIDLYTNDPNLYRVNYYKDVGSGYDLKWTGKVLPFIYSEEYKAPPYYVTVTATDGLAELKELYLVQKDGTRFYGKQKLIKIIAYCLSQTKLDLNIRVACNMYATGMNSTASDDPFDQAYVDFECFYIAEKDATLDFVLKSILEPFGCRVIQWEEKWHIIRIEELKGSYDWREFDSDGDYVTNGTTNPVVNINFPSVDGVMFTGTPNLELNPGYGKIRVTYNLGLKDNILENGDFRLMLKWIQGYSSGGYVPVLNKTGWTLVSSDYPLFDNYEIFEETNVAWALSSDDQIILSQNAGRAYILSDTYNVKMGVNNSLKFTIRYNVARSSLSPALLPIGVTFPYVKVRIKVQYGSLYLTSSGTWSSTDNTIDYIETKLNEWIVREITAFQPDSGTPLDGMNLTVSVFHASPYYQQFTSLTSLRAFVTRSGTGYPDNITVPVNYKTELRDTFTYSSYLYYYELKETTEAESGYDIVRPDDYHATHNPRAWVMVYRRAIFSLENEKITFKLDKVEMKFLVEGKEPISSVVRVGTAEANNKRILEKEFIIGSSGDLIVSDAAYYYDIFSLFPKYLPVTASSVTTQILSILSSDLIYTGWLRNVSDVAWDTWTRDGVGEADKLYGVWIKQVAAQYNASWRLLRAGLTSKTQIFTLINSFKEVNENNRIYMPVSGTISDFNNSFSGELLEIGLGTETVGSDGTTTAAFTSSFSIDFGQNFD